MATVQKINNPAGAFVDDIHNRYLLAVKRRFVKRDHVIYVKVNSVLNDPAHLVVRCLLAGVDRDVLGPGVNGARWIGVFVKLSCVNHGGVVTVKNNFSIRTVCRYPVTHRPSTKYWWGEPPLG